VVNQKFVKQLQATLPVQIVEKQILRYAQDDNVRSGIVASD